MKVWGPMSLGGFRLESQKSTPHLARKLHSVEAITSRLEALAPNVTRFEKERNKDICVSLGHSPLPVGWC